MGHVAKRIFSGEKFFQRLIYNNENETKNKKRYGTKEFDDEAKEYGDAAASFTGNGKGLGRNFQVNSIAALFLPFIHSFTHSLIHSILFILVLIINILEPENNGEQHEQLMIIILFTSKPVCVYVCVCVRANVPIEWQTILCFCLNVANFCFLKY